MIRAEWDGKRYVVNNYGWYSDDGNNWIDSSGRPVEESEFKLATIILVGGPRNDQVVA